MHVRGALTPQSLAGLVASDPTPGQSVVVDMREVTFATPAPLVAACVSIEVLVKRGVLVRVTAPRSTNAANYLARAHFPAELDALGVPHDFPTVRENYLGNNLIELHRFDEAAAVDRLAATVFDFARPHSEKAAEQLHIAVCEAGGNVCAHSQAGHGYLLAQFFPAQSRFDFAIGDSGIGYLANLRRLGAANHGHALQLAAEEGVSSTGEVGRGMGIALMREGLSTLSGGLTLLSGDASRYYSGYLPDGRGDVVMGRLDGAVLGGHLKTR